MKMKVAIRSVYLLIFVGLIIAAQLASAATTDLCIQDNWADHGNTQNLTCTANDVRIAEVTNICVGDCCQKDGCQPSCIKDQNVTFTADFKVELTAKERYDIGLYIGSQSSTVNSKGVLTGTCNDFIITPSEETCKNPPCDSSNTTIFTQLDSITQPTDTCGDIQSNTKTSTLYNPQLLNLTVTTLCEGDESGHLKLPNCTSWRTSGQNDICTGTAEAYPGSPSKCNCQPAYTIDILTMLPSISVTKAASPTQVPEGPIGGVVTYKVDVTNNSSCFPTPCTPTSSVLFDGLNDTPYGDVTQVTPTNTKVLGTTCGVAVGDPGLGSLSGETSAAGTLPATLAPSDTYECFFQATVSNLSTGDSLSDTVCTTGATDTTTGSLIPNKCGSASVSATDVKPTAAVVKNAAFVRVICVEIGYTVQVNNTDTAESLTLTALTDNKVGGDGDITTVHDNILGTTCGVATTEKGLGTLKDLDGAGTLPATIGIGGNYTCQFNAEVCSFPQTDTVTATLNDDENNSITPEGSKKVSDVGDCSLQ
jgi:hypothetical protein